jgi:hypothetical protein
MSVEEPKDRLRKAREAKFESAEAAALAYGWTVSSYRSRENGTRGIRWRAAKRDAKALGVSAAWIMDGPRRDSAFKSNARLQRMDQARARTNR